MRHALIGLLAVPLLFGCDRFEGEDHPTSQLRFPIGVAADPDQKHLYVSNSNFDLAFLGANIVVIDIDTHAIVPGASVQTKSFTGKLAVLPNADNTQAAGLYVPSREDGSVTWIEVGRDADGKPTLDCTDDVTKEGRAQSCGGEEDKHVIGGTSETDGAGRDPFGAVVAPAAGSEPARLITTSFQGRMSIFELGPDGRHMFVQHVDLGAGSYDVALHPITRAAYSTTKLLPGIDKVSVSSAPVLEEDPADEGLPADIDVDSEPAAIIISNPTKGRDFGRGIAFSRDGTRMFAAYRTPPSLLVVDTSVNAAGEAADRLLDAIPLGNGPAAVAVGRSGKDGRDLVYVTLFDSDKVAVIDPALLTVIALIDAGNGPFDITIVDRAEPRLLRAYVTLFEDHALSVIELDPSSPFYHQEIARIP